MWRKWRTYIAKYIQMVAQYHILPMSRLVASLCSNYKAGCFCIGNLLTMVRMDKWATSKSTHFQQKFGLNCSFCLKMLNFEAFQLTENLSPLQGPTHTLTPSSINTQNRSKNYLWIYHGLHWTQWYRWKFLPCWKSRIWLPVVFKKFPDTCTKTHWSWAQFQKGILPL